MVVDLGAGAATDGNGGHDSLIHIEGAIGSGFNDSLLGGAGDDSFEGGGGYDTIDGGGGTNTAAYADDPSGVSVSLQDGDSYAYDGYGNSDQLTNIQNLIGSDHNDNLQGADSQDNLIAARGGTTISSSLPAAATRWTAATATIRSMPPAPRAP